MFWNDFSNSQFRKIVAITRLNPTNLNFDEKKMTIMSLVLVLVFVNCNSFYCLYYLLRGQKVMTKTDPLSRYLYSTAYVLTVLNSSVNVIIYGILDMKFWKSFLSLFGPSVPQQGSIKIGIIWIQDSNKNIIPVQCFIFANIQWCLIEN